jgi:hypothetical protein
MAQAMGLHARAAHPQPFRYPTQRHRRLGPQSARDPHLTLLAFALALQLRFVPRQSVQFFPYNHRVNDAPV